MIKKVTFNLDKNIEYDPTNMYTIKKKKIISKDTYIYLKKSVF
jgi:hypothetical protein